MSGQRIETPTNRGDHAGQSSSRRFGGVRSTWRQYTVIAVTGGLIVFETFTVPTAGDLVVVLLPLSFLVVGGFVAVRQAHNVEAQLVLLTGLAWAVALAVPFDGSWVIPLALMTIHLPLRFPNGELVSQRWNPFSWYCIVMPIVVAIVVSTSSEVREAGGPNPYYVEWTAALVPLTALLPIAMVVAVGSLIVRYRRSGSLERLQMRWIAFAGALIVTVWVVTVVASLAFDRVQGTGGAGQSWFDTDYPTWVLGLQTLSLLSFLLVPLSFGIAIAKFRLYEIDVIISRSLTFGVLVVFIGGVYVAIVVGLGELLGRGDGSSLGLSVAATAVVAIAFQPVRSRVELWANRLVYGERATLYEVLARFAHGAAEESDQDVLDRIPRLIVDGTGAAKAALWVRSDGGFETASSWPEAGFRRTADGTGVFEDPQADLSLPVLHDGELLGGISLMNARGASIAPAERELLENLADGLGLTLRNSQLTVALHRQVKELRGSRDRVVSAADGARRSLEHDLDSGPQQHLVAVKVKLGPVRKLAEQAGAQRTAGVLADIESQAGDAIQAVRDFAAGIYPPLLGAEGLVVALSQEAKRAALPVEIDAEGVGRYPRDVESAVYFSILEALQNTAKYAEATRAWIRLGERNGDLWFEVNDDGRGFNTAEVRRGVGLNGIADRLDTIGGTTSITSTPGHGTVISGSASVSEDTLV